MNKQKKQILIKLLKEYKLYLNEDIKVQFPALVSKQAKRILKRAQGMFKSKLAHLGKYGSLKFDLKFDNKSAKLYFIGNGFVAMLKKSNNPKAYDSELQKKLGRLEDPMLWGYEIKFVDRGNGDFAIETALPKYESGLYWRQSTDFVKDISQIKKLMAKYEKTVIEGVNDICKDIIKIIPKG